MEEKNEQDRRRSSRKSSSERRRISKETDVPQASFDVSGNITDEILTDEEERIIERQMMMSPPIVASPCPSELDEISRRSGSRAESILANEDVGEEEEDLSADGGETVGTLPSVIPEEDREAVLSDIEKYRRVCSEGMKLIVLGKLDDAKKTFESLEHKHPLMANGAAFVDYFSTIVSFDEPSFPNAKQRVARCQKICKQLMQLSRKKLKHEKGVSRGSLPELKLSSIVTYYESRISIADCWCYTGVLTACKMEFTAYVKAGWQLRRAFKIYAKVYRELNSARIKSLRFPGESGTKERERLLTSASFGYGIFHLGLSLVPPSQLQLLKMFGMAGDRRVGLMALRYCVEKGWGQGLEPRAPFALMLLLWYYIYLRPGITLSRCERLKSQVYAKTLMRQYKIIPPSADDLESITRTNGSAAKFEVDNLGEGVLFVILRARLVRNAGKLDESVAMLEKSLKTLGKEHWMKEFNQMLKNDIAWCNLCQSKYKMGADLLVEIHEVTRWSKVNNLFPATLAMGILLTARSTDADLKAVVQKFNQIKSAKVRAGNPVEMYVQSRACFVLETMQQQTKPKTKNPFYKSDVDLIQTLCELFLYEALYHWTVLARCFPSDVLIGKVIPFLKRTEGNKDLESLSKFLQGVIYKHEGRFDEAEQALLCAKTPKFSHKRFKFVQPYACVELASLTVGRAEAVDANANKDNCIVDGPEVSQYLAEAKKYKANYDLESRIQFNVHNFTKTGDELWNASIVQYNINNSQKRNSLTVPSS